MEAKLDKVIRLKKKGLATSTGGAGPTSGNGALNQFGESVTTAWKAYRKDVQGNQRLLLIDFFCTGLVILGVIQFMSIAILRDTFPFNAFLSGFISCVGQFVLLVSLRMQTVAKFKGISDARAFAEFIFASLVLHFLCLHFIN